MMLARTLTLTVLGALPLMVHAAPSSGCTATVSPGDDVQSALTAAGPGSTVCFAAGTFRITTPLVPEPSQTLVGAAGRASVLDGARIVMGFTSSGTIRVNRIKVPVFNAPAFLPRRKGNHGFCRIKGCTLQEDVYRDGVPLTRVLSKSKLVSGAFYASYSRNTIWLLDDPTGHVIEQATAPAIVESETSNGVTVRGFTIEGAANAAQHGAIHAEGATGWDIADNEVRDNHGTGIIAAASTVESNTVDHNGQLGIGGCCGEGGQVSGNEIAFNNTAGYDAGWEAGGAKWAIANDLTVSSNNVHDNAGPGLWCDINCYNATFTGNTLSNNVQLPVSRKQLAFGAGIMYEISRKATITGNTLTGNGPGPGNVGFYVGANILVSASPAVEIANNVVTGTNGIGILQQHRTDSCSYTYPDGAPACTGGYHQATDEFVHDNTITETGGGEVAGLDEDFGSAAPFAPAANNRFEHDTYHLPSLTDGFFAWNDDDLTVAQWVAAGQDTNGTFSSP